MIKSEREYWGEDRVNGRTRAIRDDDEDLIVDHFPDEPPEGTGQSDPGSNGPPLPVLNPPPILEKSKIKLSQKSGLAPFETLFNDYQLQAEPVYNFWEQNEDTNVGAPQGNRDLVDIPRYIQLWWNQATDIKDPDKYRKDRLKGQDPNARYVTTKLSPFGFGSREIVSSAQNGMVITPKHMKPENFPSNANNLANGYVFSGIIEATSEVQPQQVSKQKFEPLILDEDEYLSDLTNAGISVSDVESALWYWKSSVFGLSIVMANGAVLSNEAKLRKEGLFDGQFAMASPSNANGAGIIGANPSSPNLNARGRTSSRNLSEVDAQEKFIDTVPVTSNRNKANTAQPARPSTTQVRQPIPARPTSPTAQPGRPTSPAVSPTRPAGQPQPAQVVKVKLLHTNLGNLYSNAHINSMTEPHHAENAIALVPFVGNLVAYAAAGVQHYRRDVVIPGTPVAKDIVKPLEYIGYVIEKFEQINDSFQKVDTIYIPGREYDSYNDCEIKYGSFYRYRIRGVLRWSRPKEVGILGVPSTFIPANLNIDITPYEVSYFGSEWGNEWAYSKTIDCQNPAPPDEFVVRPISNNLDHLGSPRPIIEITFKLPYNPQRDINKMTLWRKLIDENNVEVDDWKQIQEQSGVDRQGDLLSISVDFEHEQDDMTGMKILAREKEQTAVFVEYAPFNARFVDENIAYGFKYVYAALCHTKHGETSKLSDQLAARVNKDWNRDGEFPVEFVSCAGVDKDYDTGPFRTYPEIRTRTEVITNTKYDHEKDKWIPAVVGFTGQTRIAQKMLSGNNYMVRVESLDTGEHIDIPVTIVMDNQPEQFLETTELSL